MTQTRIPTFAAGVSERGRKRTDFIKVSILAALSFLIAPQVSVAQGPTPPAERTGVIIADSRTPVLPLGEQRFTQFEKIRSAVEACEALEGKIVTYFSVTAVVEKCEMRPIEDIDTLNRLIRSHQYEIVEIPLRIYRMLPMSKTAFVPRDANIQTGRPGPLSEAECKAVNGKYLTDTGVTFYFIEGCTKRPFKEFSDLQAHNQAKRPIESRPTDFLERLATGKPMEVRSSAEARILLEMDGDAGWSRLQQRRGEASNVDTLEALKQRSEENNRRINKTELCKDLDRRIVSFYSRIYFVDGCEYKPVSDFGMEIQRHLERSGGIRHLTQDEMLAFPIGREVDSQAILRRIR